MLQACVGLSQELNFDYIQELKVLKMHQAICGETDILVDLDENVLRQRRKQLKVEKKKQKEEYKNLKNIEDAGLQELKSLASSIEKQDAEIKAGLEREKQLIEQRSREGQSGWQVPINDPCYGNLKFPVEATKEGCQKVITAQERVISSLKEELEKEREKHGAGFERRIEELRREVIALSFQMRTELALGCPRETPGGGQNADHLDDEVNRAKVEDSSNALWKELLGLEILEDGSVEVMVNDSFVTVRREGSMVKVCTAEGDTLKEVNCPEEEWKLGTMFADLVNDIRNPKSNS